MQTTGKTIHRNRRIGLWRWLVTETCEIYEQGLWNRAHRKFCACRCFIYHGWRGLPKVYYTLATHWQGNSSRRKCIYSITQGDWHTQVFFPGSSWKIPRKSTQPVPVVGNQFAKLDCIGIFGIFCCGKNLWHSPSGFTSENEQLWHPAVNDIVCDVWEDLYDDLRTERHVLLWVFVSGCTLDKFYLFSNDGVTSYRNISSTVLDGRTHQLFEAYFAYSLWIKINSNVPEMRQIGKRTIKIWKLKTK